MNDLLKDIHYTVRSLARTPIFTIVTILTFALGIGITTGMFSLVNGVLLSPLPYREPKQLLIVHEAIPELRETYPVFNSNARSILAWQRDCRSTCSGVAAVGVGAATLTGSRDPEYLQGIRTSANFFDVIGVAPVLGRTLIIEDESRNVVVLGHNLWQRRFGGDERVIGRMVQLDDQLVEIVGVLPESFTLRFADWSSIPTTSSGEAEFVRPLVFSDDQRRSAGEYDYIALVRAKPRASTEQVRAELAAITDAAFRDAELHPKPVVHQLADQIIGEARRPLWLLFAAVLAALLVACLNISGLLTARWSGRRRELVIRSVLGASTGRIIRPIFAEALLLSAAGAAIGLLVASGSLKLLLATIPVDIPRVQQISIDWTTLVFAAALTAGVGVLCGLIPGWRARRSNPADTLKGASLFITTNGGSVRMGEWLITVQVAVTTVLLVVGGLLVASFAAILSVDRGFDASRAVAADVTLPTARYPAESVRVQFFEELISRVEAIPGIEHVGISQRLPLEGVPTVDALVRFGDTAPSVIASQMSVTNFFYVSDDYPAAIGMSLRTGRFPTKKDRGRRVALITESTARRLWPNGEAVGQRFFRGDPRRKRVYEVVGVVADLPIGSLEQRPGTTAFLPASDSGRGTMSIVVRAHTSSSAVTAMRSALNKLDKDLPLYNVRTLEEVLSRSVAGRRFQMLLTSAFSIAAVLLACLGLYGVITTAVGRQRRELALRLILGSMPGDVITRVLGVGLRSVTIGVVAGVVGALGLSGFIRASLFGIAPHDPLVIGAVVFLVFIISVLACLVPAISAAHTPPALVLRE